MTVARSNAESAERGVGRAKGVDSSSSLDAHRGCWRVDLRRAVGLPRSEATDLEVSTEHVRSSAPLRLRSPAVPDTERPREPAGRGRARVNVLARCYDAATSRTFSHVRMVSSTSIGPVRISILPFTRLGAIPAST
jgi:hypothetical protein